MSLLFPPFVSLHSYYVVRVAVGRPSTKILATYICMYRACLQIYAKAMNHFGIEINMHFEL